MSSCQEEDLGKLTRLCAIELGNVEGCGTALTITRQTLLSAGLGQAFIRM